ncbi:MAG: hypothetical protein ACOC7R_00330 [Planctomycetota bacterium]
MQVHCRFAGSTIETGDTAGYGSGCGMKIRGCTNTTVRRCVFTNLNKCISTSDEQGLTLEQNFVYAFRSDAFYVGGSNLLIADNLAVDNEPYVLSGGQSDHPDMVQPHGIRESVIRDNLFRGRAQGVFGTGTDSGWDPTQPAGGVTVVNNMLQSSMRNVIRMGDMPDSLVAFNTVLDDGTGYTATAEVQGSSPGTIVEHNVAEQVNTSAGEGVTYRDNIEVQRDNPDGANYDGDVFVDAMANENASIADYAPQPGVFDDLPVPPGVDLGEFFWLTVGNPSDPANEMHPLWLQLDAAGRDKLAALLELSADRPGDADGDGDVDLDDFALLRQHFGT